MEEFFQLFKTPWEWYAPHRKYDVVLATQERPPADLDARALVVYQAKYTEWDRASGVQVEEQRMGGWIHWEGRSFPVYGAVAVLQSIQQPLLHLGSEKEPVGGPVETPGCATVRIGLDLFSEIGILLTEGQTPANARIPTLEIHIAVLRSLMVGLGVAFIEVPPKPANCAFTVCLTHDVDFVGIRDHRCDHTFWGFLYRCLVASCLNAIRGRLSWSKCIRNLRAALSLPLVYLGILEDFWLQEFEHYQQIEKGLGSTFFFIPFPNTPGALDKGPAPARRAAKYDVFAIKDHIQRLIRGGCEIGVHGIDAWRDPESASRELQQVGQAARQPVAGARMHWLYWAPSTPKNLEEAGFTYDSTFGYNDAVGFRAGTTQPFRPIGADRLLELPLNIQDSALFYQDRMNLSETEALRVCREVIGSTLEFYGTLTINWHTRSLSPERLWGDFYRNLLKELRTHSVWFGTARAVTEWFETRRSISFGTATGGETVLKPVAHGGDPQAEPAFMVRIHCPQEPAPYYTDIPWPGDTPLTIRTDELPGCPGRPADPAAIWNLSGSRS